jgi:hypothetical protein
MGPSATQQKLGVRSASEVTGPVRVGGFGVVLIEDNARERTMQHKIDRMAREISAADVAYGVFLSLMIGAAAVLLISLWLLLTA